MKSIDLFKLDGKCAVVTGAASPRGIGAAVAEGFAEAGASVVLADLKDPSETAKAIAERTGAKVIGVQMDMCDDASIQHMIDEAKKAFGKIDILVNNAGTTCPDRISTLTMDVENDFARVLEVNVVGTVRVTKAVVKHMVDNGIKGSVIVTSSTGGMRATGPQGGHAYSASKAALNILVKSWALEFASKGVRVNATAPGFVKSDLTDMWDETWVKWKTPLFRFPDAEEIKSTYLYLASDASAFVTGTILVCDGGTEAGLFYDPILRGEGDPTLEKMKAIMADKKN